MKGLLPIPLPPPPPAPQVTVVVCMGSALVLILAPEEPWPNLFNGGDYTRIPALVLLLAALLSVLIGFLGCCGLLMDSRGTLIVVRPDPLSEGLAQQNRLGLVIALPSYPIMLSMVQCVIA